MHLLISNLQLHMYMYITIAQNILRPLFELLMLLVMSHQFCNYRQYIHVITNCFIPPPLLRGDPEGLRWEEDLHIHMRVVKGDWNGAVSRNIRKKRWPRVGALTGTLKNPTKCLWRWKPVDTTSSQIRI